MASKRKITDKNLYDLLETVITATEQEIKKAYRKKALKCHPDKNPDNPKAAELFHELSEALEILTDAKARDAYDRTLKAKEAAKERIKVLDSKRRKLREDLEAREQAARDAEKERRERQRNPGGGGGTDEEALQREIDRLRKEGSRHLQEEQDLIRQQILKEQQGKYSFLEKSQEKLEHSAQIKVSWKSAKVPRTEPELTEIFEKYGKILTIVVGKKCAIVEFDKQLDADKAMEGEENMLELEWVSKKPKEKVPKAPQGMPTPSPAVQLGVTTNFADFEAMILGRLSAAAAAQKQNQ